MTNCRNHPADRYASFVAQVRLKSREIQDFFFYRKIIDQSFILLLDSGSQKFEFKKTILKQIKKNRPGEG